MGARFLRRSANRDSGVKCNETSAHYYHLLGVNRTLSAVFPDARPNRKPSEHAKTSGERTGLKIRRRALRKRPMLPNAAPAALPCSLPLRSLLLPPNQLQRLQQFRRRPRRQARRHPSPDRLQPPRPPPREPTNSQLKHSPKLAAPPIPSCGSI
jgi:hypothetical protein